jgi:2-dehydro-3-deoxyglucarate aldolase
MNRLKKIIEIRLALSTNQASIGSWIQIPNSSTAEIMGQAGYDWVAIDLEHGSIDIHQLPDLFRSLELGGTLPLVRLAQGHTKDCKQALDAGAGGLIIPNVESAAQLSHIREICCWPPTGKRGVGFSRANLFGKNFDEYKIEAQAPLLVAMIENIKAVENLDEIVEVSGLDAVLVGPYDLSASMGITGKFESAQFFSAMDQIKLTCIKKRVPFGIHVVDPDPSILTKKITEGFQFIAYSLDSVFFRYASQNPLKPDKNNGI